jgi:hypothetical protein
VAAGAAVTDAAASALAALGLQRGETVRFRRGDRARWQTGRVDRLERDGSLRISDADGAARAVPLGRVQVRRRGTRSVWEDVADRAGRAQQLSFLGSTW